jgi:hypothetical protein
MPVPDIFIRIIGKYVRIVHCARNCRTVCRVAERTALSMMPLRLETQTLCRPPMKCHGEGRGRMPPHWLTLKKRRRP